MRAPAHVLVALLGSAFGMLALLYFLVFPLPPLPIQGSRGLSSIVFRIELTVQCDGCLIWGLGWRVGLVAGLWVGQAYGFGLLVSVPRSLSTQPPFATQALTFISLQCDWLVKKKTLKSDLLFCFTVPFSLGEIKMRFRAENGAIWEKIALLRANQIARITSDFEMDLIKQ